MFLVLAKDLPWNDFELAFPAPLTMVMMPFTYSITNGVGIGFVAYALAIKLSCAARPPRCTRCCGSPRWLLRSTSSPASGKTMSDSNQDGESAGPRGSTSTTDPVPSANPRSSTRALLLRLAAAWAPRFALPEPGQADGVDWTAWRAGLRVALWETLGVAPDERPSRGRDRGPGTLRRVCAREAVRRRRVRFARPVLPADSGRVYRSRPRDCFVCTGTAGWPAICTWSGYRWGQRWPGRDAEMHYDYAVRFARRDLRGHRPGRALLRRAGAVECPRCRGAELLGPARAHHARAGRGLPRATLRASASSTTYECTPTWPRGRRWTPPASAASASPRAVNGQCFWPGWTSASRWPW